MVGVAYDSTSTTDLGVREFEAGMAFGIFYQWHGEVTAS